jgi:hypothetical protein
LAYLTVDSRVKIEQVFVLEAIAVQVTLSDGSSPPDLTDKVAFVNAEVAALAGTVDIRPKPSDATATSAMRFRSVFVDMFFLSVSRRKESPSLRLVIQRDLAIAPLHHFLHTTWVMHRNLCIKGIYLEQSLATKGIRALMNVLKFLS